MSSWSRKREYDYIGLLIGLFLLVVASFIFWIAQFTRAVSSGYILLGVVGTIIFIIGIYITVKKLKRLEQKQP